MEDLEKLKQYGCFLVCDDDFTELTNKKHKIEHNKFAVFDDVHVVSGSYNWTTNASNYISI